MFLDRPILGFGYGNYLKYCEDYFVEIPGVQLRGQGEGQHNTFLGLMCETGIVGTIPYCLVYFMFFRTCYRRFRNPEPGDELGKSEALMQFSILAGNLVGMQVSDLGFYNYLNNLTVLSLGMVYASFAPAVEGLPESATVGHSMRDGIDPSDAYAGSTAEAQIEGRPLMQKARSDIEQFYLSGEYLRKNPSLHVEDSGWKAEVIAPFVDRFALTHSGSPLKVLDVGGGAGVLLSMIADRLRRTAGRPVPKCGM